MSDEDVNRFLAQAQSDAEIAGHLVNTFFRKRGVPPHVRADDLAVAIVADMREFERMLHKEPLPLHPLATEREKKLVRESLDRFASIAKAAFLSQRLRSVARQLKRERG